MGEQRRTVTFVIFFEGTSNTLSPWTTQIGQFAHACSARDIRNVGCNSDSEAADDIVKIAFDGCGVTHGFGGVIFARGLDEQVAVVVDRVNRMLTIAQRVRCVVLGLSRGGIACGKLALAMAATDTMRQRVDISMLIFDPVPGNSLWFGIPYTGADCSDLSTCTNLRDVLALYPHEPLPAVAFHAPLLFRYPPDCKIEEDVMLGCHQGALFGTTPPKRGQMLTSMAQDRGGNLTCQLASNLSFRRILDWFGERDISFTFHTMSVTVPLASDCVEICRAALAADYPTRRSLFDATGENRVIVRRSGSDGCTRLNRYHDALERACASQFSQNSQCGKVGRPTTESGYMEKTSGGSDKGQAVFLLDIEKS